MSAYEEEHATTQATVDNRRDLREQIHELYQENGNSNVLLQLLSQLIPESMQEELLQDQKQGCPDDYVDSLPRVKNDKIGHHEACSICCCNYREDDYPLVVELPHCGHRFDLECVAVWLSKSTTCPLCRDDVLSHKPKIDVSQVEIEDDWGMYG